MNPNTMIKICKDCYEKEKRTITYPFQTQSLVEKTQIGGSIGHDFLSWHEAESSDSIVDSNEDERLVLGDGLRQDTDWIIGRSPPELLRI